ncbi:MAG: hypothetical protein ACO1RT_12770 [Planctomycetaceae bacterium]
MPSTFDDFGIHFLYPDNWLVQSRESDDDSDSVTLEMPNGGFFSVTKHHGQPPIDEVLESIASAMRSEYPDVEVEPLDDDSDDESDAIEFRFYYLDLLIVARITAMVLRGHTIVVQVQAESRDFDTGEPVYNAMLKSIRDGMQGA